MAKNTVADWDTTRDNNTDVGGINIAEGCPAANLNNAIREVMAQIATLDPVTGSAANTFTGDITISNSAPSLFLKDTDAVSASVFARLGTNAAGSFRCIADSNDLTADSAVIFEVDGTIVGEVSETAMTMDAPIVVRNATFGAITLAATDTADTHERVRLFKNTTGYGLQTLNAAGSVAVNDYTATVDASGANSHSFLTAGVQRLLINSSGCTSGAFITSSDARLKEDIAPLSDAEYRVAQRLKTLVRTYRLKADPAKKRFGVIAQEVAEAFEAEGLNWQEYGIITGGGDEPFGVNYTELHSLILGA